MDPAGEPSNYEVELPVVSPDEHSNSSLKKDASFISDLPSDSRPVIFKVWICAYVAAMSGLCFGFDIGGSGGTFAMTHFREHFGWPEVPAGEDPPSWVSDQQGWIAVFFSLGALAGSLPAGMLADFIGRKFHLIISAVIFSGGCLLQILASNMDMLWSGRFIGGVGIGMMSTVTGMYIGEISPTRTRGIMNTFFQINIVAGILTAGLSNLGLKHWKHGWRISYGGNIVFSILVAIGMIFLPESPRWCVLKGKTEKARDCLSQVRYEDEVERELAFIQQDVRLAKEAGSGSWVEVFGSRHKQGYRTATGMIIFFFQQLTGINAIMFFAPDMIKTFSGDDAALWGTFGIQFMNFIATFITVYLIDKVGRLPLLLSGAWGQAISLFCVSLCSMPFSDYENKSWIGNLIVVFCALFVGCFAYSWGPLAWVIIAEIQPNQLRAKAMSLSSATHWGFAAVVGKVTPYAYRKNALQLWGTFLVFATFCMLSSLWVHCCLPETADVPLEKLDDLFDNFTPGFKQANPFKKKPKVAKDETPA